MKHCKQCETDKPADDFHRDSRRKDGRYPWCKACAYAKKMEYKARAIETDPEGYAEKWKGYQRAYRERHRERYLETQRWATLKKKFGLTRQDYELLALGQGGACAICGAAPAREGKPLGVDHCHESGVIRGLPCNNCNVGIGHLRDDPDLMAKAADYVRRFKQCA